MSSDTSNRHSTEDLDKSHFSSDSEEEVVKSPKSKRKKAETKPKKSPEKKSYRCDRCNFSSGSKAKYTKHAKSAHSGTIVQCDHCEFKTPYKWNLDRHYKNHLGGGALCCHLCNFSCDIKQSLTVHLQNHHSNVPEEVIESVKRQQIPSRNQSINNNNNINANSNSNAAATTAKTAASSNANASDDTSSKSPATENDGAASETLPEKKVPPLRISRSLTGLSLGEETNSGANSTSNTSKKEEESAAAGASSALLVQNAPVVGTGSILSNESISSALAAGNDEAVRSPRKCELCDFEITGEGNGSYSSLMKKHMTNQHGVNRSGKHHKRLRASSRSTSPEYSDDSSPANPSLPVVPIPLPPKKSKGSTSPRPGQSASSSSNSPAIHRSQSPLIASKASEAISAYASNDHNLHAAGLLDNDHQDRHPSVLSAIQSRHSQLQSSGEESAFTPVGNSDFSQAQLSLLKKPKQRALAQFYQKLKTKFTAATEDNESTFCAPVESETTETAKDDVNEDSQKSTSLSSPLKSNRCQHCRQRCKSSADLAYHLERCPDAKGKAEKKDEAETFSETAKGETKVKKEKELPGKTLAEGTFQIPQKLSGSTKPEVEESDEGDFGETKVQHLNGSTVDINDGLIGFETAPGVGAIHTGKLDEIEYQGYQQDGNENGSHGEESSDNRPIEHEEEEDEEIDESTVGRKPAGKNSKATITSRKVYRCPESDCSFWATTASRFHVHIVGHYNLKPFECSECHYKSNWRWDVNKHIRLKTPKDPKHAIAKTLLTHESGQRDYRKYDNYLVAMSLTHSANAKAPDCSTAASKRIRNVVASPKSSPEIQAASATSRTESPNGSNTSTSFVPVPTSGKQKSTKLTKTPASSSSSTNSSIPPSATSEENGNSYGFHSQNAAQSQPDDTHAYPMDLAPASNSSSEGRSFVETRMLAGGEIYQTSLLKPDIGMNVNNDGDHHEGDGSTVFDLTLKRPRSRHRDRRQSPVDEIQKTQPTETVVQHDMETHSVTPPMPTKKSRLQQSEYQQQTSHYTAGAATNGSENKILSMWQCIKCNFKHSNKDVVNTHIRDQHKPKKGDPVSLLAHNHLIQVMIPEQEALMASNSPEGVDYSARSMTSDLNKEIFQQTFTEVGKVLSCKFCPFTTGLLYEMEIHADHHLNKSTSYYSCPHCSYSVAVKSELHEHLQLHGDIFQSHEIQNKLINSSTAITPPNESAKLSLLSPTSTTENLSMGKKDSKKYYCSDCPYATQDVSEFQYHKQCHEPMGYPFKCHICTFNVSVKFHLLQHLGVHGIQIDEVGIPQTSLDPIYGYPSNDYESSSTDQPQDEPLNLSIFANRKPVVIWDNNGTAIEGYRCTVCPQIFQDLNDLKEHEFVNNHRGNPNSGISNDSFIDKRQCDSPPSEAMNLCVKPVDNSTKKSSQNNSKVNSSAGKKISSNISNTGCVSNAPLSISPSQIVSTAIDQNSGSSSTKAEKEYLYLCDECPARFFFEKELKIHHTFHENKSIFSCPKCTYSARQKDPHLMSHMRVHGNAYQEKTKALLVKFPRAKVNLSPSASASAAVAASVASLLNSSILNPNFNLQTAAAALSAVGKLKPGNCVNPSFPDPSAIDGLRKNGLSIVCPKCPEKFYTPVAFQQHIELHSNGRTPASDYRCRFCDYCADSRKGLIMHEMVHTGSDITLEPSAAAAAAVVAAGKLLPTSAAFNPVSMMALIAQDSPFTSVANAALNAAGLCSTAEPDNSEKTSASVPDEAYEGNPEFVYPTYMKNGRVKSKRYKCMKCPSAFEKKDQYHTHIGLHGSNQKYKCTVCDYAVTYYANYIQHLKKHENQQNIPSELLNLGRKRHLDEDGNGSLLKIPKMAENGENSSSSSVSGASVGSVDSNENQSVMKCSFCPFHCYDESTLESHLIHHQENPNWLHVCSICSYRTSSKKSLKEHARLHLLSGFHHIQNQQDWRNGEQNTNGTGSHRGGEYVNGYADNHRYHGEKHQNFEGEEHDDSSNGSL